MVVGAFGLLVLWAPPAEAQARPDSAVHVVRAGETIYRIASRYGLTVAELRVLNGLGGEGLRVGQRLLLRADADASVARGRLPDTTGTSPMGRFVARPGDTYYTIGARLGVSPDTLWLLNGEATAPLEEGVVVHLPPRFATVTYEVRRGDTLFGIAQVNGVRVEALRRLNDLQGDRLDVGQVLEIPLGETPPPKAAAALPQMAFSGPVLRYPDAFAGRVTASGDVYDPERFTVSHATLPLGTLVHLTSPASRRTTFAEVTDRGPLDPDYLLDVSAAVAEVLAVEDGDRVEVRIIRP